MDGGEQMLNKLKEVREAKGFTVLELAQKSAVTRQTIYNIEKNANAVVSSSVMEALSKALDAKPSEIFLI
jgi:transcriptional regulator with XRE-family HTH domain